MKVTLDHEAIEIMNLFQKLTGTTVIDSIADNDELYFVVREGQYGLAVGKNGSKIKKAEDVFKKMIKVFEYSEDLEKFIRNLIPESQEISIEGKEITVKVKPSDRARVIGKEGKNVKVINRFLERLFDVDVLRVK